MGDVEKGGRGDIMPQLFLVSGVTSMIFDHFTLRIYIMFDSVVGLQRGRIVMGWFLREEFNDIKDGPKFLKAGATLVPRSKVAFRGG